MHDASGVHRMELYLEISIIGVLLSVKAILA